MGNWSTRQLARQTGSAADIRRAIAGTAEDAALPVEVSSRERVVVTASMIGGKKVEITEGDIARLNLPSDNDRQTISASMCAVYQLKK